MGGAAAREGEAGKPAEGRCALAQAPRARPPCPPAGEAEEGSSWCGKEDALPEAGLRRPSQLASLQQERVRQVRITGAAPEV